MVDISSFDGRYLDCSTAMLEILLFDIAVDCASDVDSTDAEDLIAGQ